MKKVTLIILVGLISLTACKKYEEGPLISLRSKENRLCQKWKLYDAYWNGDPAEIKNTLIEFSKDGKYHSISNVSFSTTVEENYNWKFINKKMILKFMEQDMNINQVMIQLIRNMSLIQY